MRGKSNMENRKNTQLTKIHSQQDPWTGSMDPDWIWSQWSVSRAICPQIRNQKLICRYKCKVARHLHKVP